MGIIVIVTPDQSLEICKSKGADFEGLANDKNSIRISKFLKFWRYQSAKSSRICSASTRTWTWTWT